METSPQSQSLFNYYNFYRVVVSILLFGISISQHSVVQEFRSPLIFEALTPIYLGLNLFWLLAFRFLIDAHPKQIFITLLLDILLLHALFYFASGISGGLANLIIISVAAGNIIIRGRIGLSFAAWATLLTILIEGERFLNGFNSLSDVPRTGLIGCMYFASAYILQYLSIKISENESLLKQQEQDLRKLEKLNHQIIQSMRTGIIVCSEQGEVKLINHACLDLVSLAEKQPLPSLIADRLTLWKEAPGVRTTPFRVSQEKPLVQANFSRLQNEAESDILVFLDDTRKTAQQAQHMKLASLGRLTASIAHEVRNPLGAISHATQLLAESENLDPADHKMTDIIQRHSKRVNQIIENTLQLSRRTEPEVEDITLANWIDKIVGEYKGHLHSSDRINIILADKDATARFDPSQMEQVFINLIDNGLRHGLKSDCSAQLFILLSKTTKDGQAYIEVIDQGEGVSEENSHHLFEPFFTTESQGTGLGLYLSREICEANQAHLDYINPASTEFHQHWKFDN
ncbi:PAS domain-containing sensor histidine kinase, partial [Oleiphilus sp. HI0128]